MDTPTPKRSDDRARAMRRLRAMTIGTALAGVAATGGFGWLAATTHPGSTATIASVESTTVSDHRRTSTSATATASPTTTGSSSPSVTSSSGRAQVSTGGS